MSIGYLPRADLSLIVSMWDGVVTAEAWRHNLEKVLADPAFPSTTVHLVDLRSADIEGTITEQDIKDIVEFLGSHAAEIAGLHVPGYRLHVAWGRPWGGPAEPADPGRSTTWGKLKRLASLRQVGPEG